MASVPDLQLETAEVAARPFLSLPAYRTTPSSDTFVASSDTFVASHMAARRYSDHPLSSKIRIISMIAACLVCILLMATGFLHWTDPVSRRVSTAALTMFEVAPPRTPPAIPNEKPPGLQPPGDEAHVPPPRAARTPRAAPGRLPPALSRPLLVLPASSAATAPALALTPASLSSSPPAAPSRPSPLQAPPARSAASAEPASEARSKWEALLLAALNRAKRYPRDATRKREQGAATIRFLVDRRGRVHAVMLMQSSGSASLDAEALAIPRRAQPLPRPPADLAGPRIKLTVPIEFLVR